MNGIDPFSPRRRTFSAVSGDPAPPSPAAPPAPSPAKRPRSISLVPLFPPAPAVARAASPLLAPVSPARAPSSPSRGSPVSVLPRWQQDLNKLYHSAGPKGRRRPESLDDSLPARHFLAAEAVEELSVFQLHGLKYLGHGSNNIVFALLPGQIPLIDGIDNNKLVVSVLNRLRREASFPRRILPLFYHRVEQARQLEAAGIPAARIYHADPADGCLVIEKLAPLPASLNDEQLALIKKTLTLALENKIDVDASPSNFGLKEDGTPALFDFREEKEDYELAISTSILRWPEADQAKIRPDALAPDRSPD
jgi:hypothetical protein